MRLLKVIEALPTDIKGVIYLHLPSLTKMTLTKNDFMTYYHVADAIIRRNYAYDKYIHDMIRNSRTIIFEAALKHNWTTWTQKSPVWRQLYYRRLTGNIGEDRFRSWQISGRVRRLAHRRRVWDYRAYLLYLCTFYNNHIIAEVIKKSFKGVNTHTSSSRNIGRKYS